MGVSPHLTAIPVSQSLSGLLKTSLFVSTVSTVAPKILWSGAETAISSWRFTAAFADACWITKAWTQRLVQDSGQDGVTPGPFWNGAHGGRRGKGSSGSREDCSRGCVGEAWRAAEQRRTNAVFGHAMSCQRISGSFKLVNGCFRCNFVGLIKQKEGKHWGLGCGWVKP